MNVFVFRHSRGSLELALAALAGVTLGAAGMWALGHSRHGKPAIKSDAPTTDSLSLHLPPEAVKNAGLETVISAPGALPITREVTAKIGLNQDRLARVAARVSGIVRDISVHLGQHVQTGQVLLTLDSPEAGQVQLDEQTRAQELATAQTHLQWTRTISTNIKTMLDALAVRKSVETIERELAQRPVGEDWGKLLTAYSRLLLAEQRQTQLQPLYRKGTVGERQYREAQASAQEAEATFRALVGQTRYSSQTALLNARQAVERAESALTVSRKQRELLGLPPDDKPSSLSEAASGGLGLYRITAPFGGIIIEKTVVIAERVEPAQTLLTLADLATVWVEVDLHEQDLAVLPDLRQATVQIVANAYPGRTFPARVVYAGDVFDPETRVIHLIAEVANPERLLKPGMFVRAALSEPYPASVMRVPETALQTDAGRTFVFVAAPSGTDFERRDVTLGRQMKGWVEVRSGIAAGQRIVSRGSYLLKSQLMLDRIGND